MELCKLGCGLPALHNGYCRERITNCPVCLEKKSQSMKYLVFDNIEGEACSYCGKLAKFKRTSPGNKKRGKKAKTSFCCLPSHHECPAIKEKKKKTCLKNWGAEHQNKNKQVSNSIRDSHSRRTLEAKEEAKLKHKNTCLKRYQVDNYSKTEKFKKECQVTNRLKYGVNYLFQLPGFYKKAVEKKIELYGENWKEIEKEKRKKTCLKNYGVEYNLLSPNFKNQSRATCMTKYGVDHHMKSKKVLNIANGNRIRVLIEKYGVVNSIFVPGAIEKAQKGSYLMKPYKLPSGKIAYLQGYEPKVMRELLEQFNEKEIVWQRNLVPRIIWVDLENKKHTYFPDFYIPRLNWLIEVKSAWTFQRNKENNLLKYQAAKSYGFKFNFLIR